MAEPVTIFVVLITTANPHLTVAIGSCHWNELAAQHEVKRLNDANRYTRATYVARQVEYPSWGKDGWE